MSIGISLALTPGNPVLRNQGAGVPSGAITLKGQPIMLKGQYITLTKAA